MGATGNKPVLRPTQICRRLLGTRANLLVSMKGGDQMWTSERMSDGIIAIEGERVRHVETEDEFIFSHQGNGPMAVCLSGDAVVNIHVDHLMSAEDQ